MITEETIKTMVDTLVKEINPERVYIFGSVARGEAREDSDIDFLVVEREPFSADHSRFQETNRIYQALSRFRVPADVLLYSVDEFDEWKTSINHVVGRCEREGKLVYARR